MGVYIKRMTKQQALQWLHYQMPFTFQVSDDDITEIEIPHGRLIDADILQDNFDKNYVGVGDGKIAGAFEETPTVIEREEVPKQTERTISKIEQVSDYIKREVAIATVERMYEVCTTADINDYRDLLLACFEDLPFADVVERKESK